VPERDATKTYALSAAGAVVGPDRVPQPPAGEQVARLL